MDYRIFNVRTVIIRVRAYTHGAGGFGSEFSHIFLVLLTGFELGSLVSKNRESDSWASPL